MPLYEYRCLKCGKVTEVLQKLSDPPLRRCSHCSGKVEKMISRTSFHLKGGGWYAQGYGQESQKKSGGGESTDAPSGSSPASGEASPSEAPSKKKKETKEAKETKSEGSASGGKPPIKAAAGS